MKILQVISLLGTGGVERQVLYLADGMIAQGHDVRIMVLRGPSTNTVFKTRAPIHLLGMTKSPWGILRAVWRARRTIREFRPDVVHCHMFHAIIFIRLLRPFASIPYLVCTPHQALTSLNQQEGSKKYALTYRLTDRLADLMTNVGEEATRTFLTARAVPPGRIRTVHNGYDTERFQPNAEARTRLRKEIGLREGTFMWLAVGRLCDAKDYPNMIAAFARVTALCPNTMLFIAGDGPLDNACREMIASMHLGEAITLLGVRSDIPDLMAAADGYVLSSAWEALPMVIGEAMASGLPVVATACSGVQELLGGSDFTVPPKDAGALAEAMMKLINFPLDRRWAIGAENRERLCKYFSLERKCSEWIMLYKERPSRN